MSKAQIFTSPTQGHDHIQGSIDAPFKLIEYGDYQCPFCADAHEVVKEIQGRLGDQICFVFRNFPLVEIHPFAEHAAEAAESAAGQGRFWEMHDMLFENQQNLGFASLLRYAEQLLPDADQWVEDMRKHAFAERVRDDFTSGVRSAVNGTPTFFINGVRYDGPLEVPLLERAVRSVMTPAERHR